MGQAILPVALLQPRGQCSSSLLVAREWWLLLAEIFTPLTVERLSQS